VDYPLLFLGGPTGSGKSKLAVRLADHFPSEILNADSRQIYRDLVIGTNQPSVEQIRRVPHHLFGFLDPAVSFSAAEYERKALSIIRSVTSTGKMMIVVGGTGFYMKALLKGVWLVPPRNQDLRKRFQEMEIRQGMGFLHKMLKRLDPPSATKISANDDYRIIRALEIFFQSGRKRSELPQNREERFPALKFYLEPDRAVLYENIRERTEKMFEEGWVEEVVEILKNYPDFENLPAAASIGYREIVLLLMGQFDSETCKQTIIRKTCNYAKRQLTWFRNQDSFIRLPSGKELHKILESVLKWRGDD
jgi:tRNA dimethylallyltransferase